MISNVDIVAANAKSVAAMQKINEYISNVNSKTDLFDFNKTINKFYQQNENIKMKDSMMSDMYVELNPSDNLKKDKLIQEIFAEVGINKHDEIQIPTTHLTHNNTDIIQEITGLDSNDDI